MVLMVMNLILLTNKIMNMKKIIYILSILVLASSCSLFELDNYDEPNAGISGNIIDAQTKENLAVECKFGNVFGGVYMGAPSEGYISVYEKGWDFESAQYWHLMNDGTYRHAKIFAGEYRMEANANNFYPISKDNVVINEGENQLDWEVVPYVRIIDPKVEYTGGKFVATFKCAFGDASKANKIVNARLLCYPDTFVGVYCNYCSQDPGATSKDVVVDGKTVNTLTIDPTLSVNQTEFKYDGKYHYFRIAVCAEGNGYNTGRHYNYCQTIKILL